MRSLLACFLSLTLSVNCIAQKEFQLKSPNGKIAFTIRGRNTYPEYQVSFKGQALVDWSPMQVSTADGELTKNAKLKLIGKKDTTENYVLLTGKTSKVSHPYRELRLACDNNLAGNSRLEIVIRAFNDGVAFRYQFMSANRRDSLLLTDEQTTFNLRGNPVIKALVLPSYTTSHEGPYTTVSFDEFKEDSLADMPFLIQYPSKTFMAITEAALLDYAGMYLTKVGGRLKTFLSPLPGQKALKIKAALPHQSPWRVMMIGESMATLIESNILTSLCPPQKLRDWSWIKPGTSTFPWWNGNVLPDTINAPGNNFVTQQYYIDFCARNNITYHSVVEYGLHQWYTDDGVAFQAGPNADVTKPVPGLDMKQVCDYAHSKGVDIRVWVHWAALYPKLDSAFAQFERWGISGMMVDFMDRDDQQMVNIQTEILEKAAKHKLHIQFHGAYKPTGLQRTYPNEFTREGTMNYEVHKWDRKVTPDHDLDIVFTRGLAGPTDYHLGGFRAVPDSLVRVQYTRPLMMGTRGHSLAMFIVLESALQMVCDYPEAYEGQVGFSFLKELPTTWDEVKVIDARLGSHAAIARRKGDTWYVGVLNNRQAKALKLPLSFLENANYSAQIFSDAANAATQPNNLSVQTIQVNKLTVLPMQLASGGGMVAIIKP